VRASRPPPGVSGNDARARNLAAEVEKLLVAWEAAQGSGGAATGLEVESSPPSSLERIARVWCRHEFACKWGLGWARPLSCKRALGGCPASGGWVGAGGASAVLPWPSRITLCMLDWAVAVSPSRMPRMSVSMMCSIDRAG